jgi:N-carbamoyl-L-amino-acid hydrolase
MELEVIWHSPPVVFAEKCVNAVTKAVGKLQLYAKKMVSGAGHDAVYVSNVSPTSMIFIPCKDGLSHNEAEYAKPENVAAGANVLLHTVLLADGN